MKLSELLFVVLLIPAMLMGFVLLGVATGNLNDDGMLLRAALVSAVPAVAFSIAGSVIRRKTADLRLTAVPQAVPAVDNDRDALVRSAA